MLLGRQVPCSPISHEGHLFLWAPTNSAAPFLIRFRHWPKKRRPPMDTGLFVLNTVGTHTNGGEQVLEGYRNSGRLSSPSFSRPSLVDTSWFFWLPVTCSPEPPLYTLSLPSSLTKLGSLPRDFSLSKLASHPPRPSGILGPWSSYSVLPSSTCS